MSRSSTCVGSRLHFIFILHLLGVKVKSIIYQEKVKKFYKGQQFRMLILDEEKLANAGFKLVIEKNQGGEREYPHLYRKSPDMLIPQSAIAEFTGEYSQLPQYLNSIFYYISNEQYKLSNARIDNRIIATNDLM